MPVLIVPVVPRRSATRLLDAVRGELLIGHLPAVDKWSWPPGNTAPADGIECLTWSSLDDATKKEPFAMQVTTVGLNVRRSKTVAHCAGGAPPSSISVWLDVGRRDQPHLMRRCSNHASPVVRSRTCPRCAPGTAEESQRTTQPLRAEASCVWRSDQGVDAVDLEHALRNINLLQDATIPMCQRWHERHCGA
jgi:hypothetical protein